MYFGEHYVGPTNDVAFALALPVQLVLGVSAGEAMMINFGIDMPMAFFVAPDAEFSLPLLTGVGVEYHVDAHLSATFNTGFGPDVFFARGGSDTVFALKVLVGIGYRL